MSKLHPDTVYKILKKSSDTPHQKAVFDRVVKEKHPLNDLSQRRMILWGDHTHMKHVIDQPTMTHSTGWLALQDLDKHPPAARKKLEARLTSNFPLLDNSLPHTYIHKNVNHKANRWKS